WRASVSVGWVAAPTLSTAAASMASLLVRVIAGSFALEWRTEAARWQGHASLLWPLRKKWFAACECVNYAHSARSYELVRSCVGGSSRASHDNGGPRASEVRSGMGHFFTGSKGRCRNGYGTLSHPISCRRRGRTDPNQAWRSPRALKRTKAPLSWSIALISESSIR